MDFVHILAWSRSLKYLIFEQLSKCPNNDAFVFSIVSGYLDCLQFEKKMNKGPEVSRIIVHVFISVENILRWS